MNNKPSGNVTFLFTDIEGSTKLSQEFPETYQDALNKHNSNLKHSIESNNGFVFEIVGDAFCCAFENPYDAVKASCEIHLNLENEDWNRVIIKVRIGIHSGHAEWNGNNYMGYITLARTARIMSVAYGEQILISENVYNQIKEKLPDSRTDNNEITFRDLGERRLKDLIQPVRIYQPFISGMREDFPPLKTLDARPNNLPVQLTNFIGREKEISDVKNLLSKTKLLTLLGPGGTGKTRLSMQVAADMIDEFKNGVWLIELAFLIESSLIPLAISNSLGFSEKPNQDIEQSLLDNLKDKEILLILDNCEHLINACAELTEKLLKGCPGLKIIATSREALRCRGEIVHRVLSLSHPAQSESVTPLVLSQYEAVRLFIERALAVNPGFRVNNENAPALAQICFRLDGIPLAIELAAARIKVLTIEKINERLDDRFKLLTGGKRTAFPRQQTLKALIDWSYDLLPEKEKILWARLSVFNGGWSLVAAEKICSDDKIESSEILDLHTYLIEKSILIYDEKNERYRILETMKQYGGARLIEANEENEFYLNHLDYFLEFSKNADLNISGSEAAYWLERLESEHSNLISAIEWAVKNGVTEKGAGMANALARFWQNTGHYSAGNRLTEILLDNAGEISKGQLGNLYSNAAEFIRTQGKFEKAQKYYEVGIELKKELGDGIGVASSLQGLGNVFAEKGDYEKAQMYYEESLSKSRKLRFNSGIAFSLNNLGNIEILRGNYEKALKLITESLEISKELGDKRAITYSLDSLANISLEQEDYVKAKNYLEEYLSIAREIGDKTGVSFALNCLGTVAFKNKDFAQAVKLTEESLINRRESGDKICIAYSLYNLCNIELDMKNYKNAKEHIEECIRLRYELGNKMDLAYSIISFNAVLNNLNCFKPVVLLSGAIESAINKSGLVLSRSVMKLNEETLRIVKENMDEKEFSKYYEEGKKMSLGEAAELALSV